MAPPLSPESGAGTPGAAPKERSFWKNPGVFLSLILLFLWALSFVLFLAVDREARLGPLPLLVWSQLLLSVLGIVFTLIAIPLFGRWEKR